MPTIEQQLNELMKQKNALATALRDKGVEAEDNETLNSLVGKVSQTVSSEEIEALQQQVATLTEENETLSEENAQLKSEANTSPYWFKLINEVVATFDSAGIVAEFKLPEGVINLNIGNSHSQISLYPNLEVVYLPSTITQIGSYSFKNCKKLRVINFRGTQSQWNAISKGTKWSDRMGSNVTGGTQIIYNYTG